MYIRYGICKIYSSLLKTNNGKELFGDCGSICLGIPTCDKKGYTLIKASSLIKFKFNILKEYLMDWMIKH